jgi:FMN-dependent NADH-azoreductase
MSQILQVIASPNGTDSHSLILSDILIGKLGGGTVRRRDLSEDAPPLVSDAYIRAVYSDPAKRTAEQKSLLRYSDKVIEELREADFVVIGTPVHNLMVPAMLKAWIDQIVRPGATIGKGGRAFADKKVYVVIASGRASNPDFIGPYLKAILAEVGLTDVTVLTLSGTAKRPVLTEDYDRIVRNLLTSIQNQ